jgi:hypothetical protein
MHRSSKAIVAAVIVLFAGAVAFLLMKNAETSSQLQGALQTQQETQDQYATAIGQIAEIQDSLSTILPEGRKLPGAASSYSSEREMGGPNSREILDRIANLRAGLERGKERVRELEASLRRSGLKLASLQKLVGGLRHTISEKEQQLTELASELSGVRDTLRVRDASLQERQRQLATVYFVAGSKHDLLASGVLEARGGLLGIGRTLQPAANAPEQLFSELNTDEEFVLPLNAAKAQVVTAQPPSSYSLESVDGRMELHILDPQQFRRVRELVIVTA